MIPFISIGVKVNEDQVNNILSILDKIDELANITEEEIDRIMKRNMPHVRASIAKNYDLKRKSLAPASEAYRKRKQAAYKNGLRVFVSDAFKRRKVLHPRAPGLRTEMLFRALRRERGVNVGVIYDVEMSQNGARVPIILNPEIFVKKGKWDYARIINDRINFMELQDTQLTFLANKFINNILEQLERSISRGTF